jgi:tetratricopeptide (TPR) repeat protein
MWRSASAGGAIFLLAAVLWAAWDPVLALKDVCGLDTSSADWHVARERLLQRGRGSLRPLRSGLSSDHTLKRLRCAQVLSLLGEDENDRVLLTALRSNSPEESNAATELLRELWRRRNGPPPEQLATLLNARPLDIKLNEPLDLCLTQYYTWAGGYLARAERNLAQEEPRLALRDALSALLLEPEHFDGMVLLGRVYDKLGLPELAVACLRHALQINPGLKEERMEELTRMQSAAQKEREKRLKARYLDFPLM